MRVETTAGAVINLGTTETTPTIGITDFSRRVTDDFGVTTIVKRGFARRMSVRLSLPFDDVDAVQRQLADLRASSALWIADDRYAWLKVNGFYKDFDLDLAVPPISFCRLTVEGLAETEVVADPGGDPAPTGQVSTLRLVQPSDGNVLVSSSVPEADHPEWAAGTSYGPLARVIKASTHRIYESVTGSNLGNDPATSFDKWIDMGPTNRWAMFDQALGTFTAANASIVVELTAATSVALLDVKAATVRLQATGYDQTQAVGGGAIVFLDLPAAGGQITVTVTGSGQVSVGTLVAGTIRQLGVTEAAPTAGITDFSRKQTDDFGEVTVVQRAWAKRMTARALIRTEDIDRVANRIAAVRARPSLWIGQAGQDSLTIYGFFKEFSIEVGETVSKLSLTIEGLSKAPPIVVAPAVLNGTSVAVAALYQRSATAPGAPTTTLTYTFATGAISGTPGNGWAQAIMSGTDPLWVTLATASALTPTDTIAAGEWAAAVKFVENGLTPTILYRRSQTTPATPTGDAPAGWSINIIPTGTDTLWSSQGTRNASGNLVGVWSAPVIAGQGVATDYNATIAYVATQRVLFGGGEYQALVNTTAGQAPTGTAQANAQWAVVAAPGATGTPGTPSGGFAATITVPAGSTQNLRQLADAAGYTGTSDATITFNVATATVIRGLSGAVGTAGGFGIDSGTWPHATKTIALTLNLVGTAIVDGGGGRGGDTSIGSGTAGGDAIYLRVPMTGGINFITGSSARGGGGGGGAGRDGQSSNTTNNFPWYGGSGGGGAANGAGGVSSSGVPATNGATGTTSGGGAGGTTDTSDGGLIGSGAITPTAGGAGGTFGAPGNGGSSGGAGGAAGFAVRKNGFAAVVTVNGATVAGTIG